MFNVEGSLQAEREESIEGGNERSQDGEDDVVELARSPRDRRQGLIRLRGEEGGSVASSDSHPSPRTYETTKDWNESPERVSAGYQTAAQGLQEGSRGRGSSSAKPAVSHLKRQSNSACSTTIPLSRDEDLGDLIVQGRARSTWLGVDGAQVVSNLDLTVLLSMAQRTLGKHYLYCHLGTVDVLFPSCESHLTLRSQPEVPHALLREDL